MDAKGAKEAGANGSFRRYRSESGSDYVQPMHRAVGDFSGWTKTLEGGKVVSLDRARYVDPKTARKLAREFGLGEGLVKAVYDPSRKVDSDNPTGGILLYTLKEMPGKIQVSKPITFIKPGIPKKPVETAIPPTEPQQRTATKPITQNYNDPLSAINEALSPTSKEDTGLDLLGGTGGGEHQGTEIISSAEIAAEADKVAGAGKK